MVEINYGLTVIKLMKTLRGEVLKIDMFIRKKKILFTTNLRIIDDISFYCTILINYKASDGNNCCLSVSCAAPFVVCPVVSYLNLCFFHFICLILNKHSKL